jgi:hypothetical protein
MSNIFRFFLFIVLMQMLLSNIGCKNRIPSGGDSVKLDAKKSGQTAVRKLDINKDGKLSVTELNNCPGLKAAIPRLTTDAQGYFTANSITQRIEQWQESKYGLLKIVCVVTHNGMPLEDAYVRFIPEDFLGDMIGISSGTTNNEGIVLFIAKFLDTEMVGVPLGFYRVSITKPGLDIPKKYNIETVLGIEVAPDAVDKDGVVKFNLSF